MGSRFPSSDFENYALRIKDYPLLTPEEEILCAELQAGDMEAGKKIITANLRFVVKISQPYFHQGYALSRSSRRATWGWSGADALRP
jgi:DNA-directed RNA polymerase sigma subunit (sigma70/sigma32)